jgi:aspartate aminotransferase-like enzyme
MVLLTKDSYASPTVTSFIPHDKDELTYIKSTLKSRFNITIAGGQGKLKGTILRIGHMGANIIDFTIICKNDF